MAALGCHKNSECLPDKVLKYRNAHQSDCEGPAWAQRLLDWDNSGKQSDLPNYTCICRYRQQPWKFIHHRLNVSDKEHILVTFLPWNILVLIFITFTACLSSIMEHKAASMDFQVQKFPILALGQLNISKALASCAMKPAWGHSHFLGRVLLFCCETQGGQLLFANWFKLTSPH